jgi:TPR repeat protein
MSSLLLLLGNYAEIPRSEDPAGLAAWAFARYHLSPNREVAEAAQRAHEAGEMLGTFVCLLCQRDGVGVLHDEATMDRLNYQLRTQLEAIEKPSTWQLYLLSKCLPGDERGVVETSLAEATTWQGQAAQRRWELLRQAAEMGMAQAWADAGRTFQNQGNVQQAFLFYQQAGRLGLAEGKRGAGFLMGKGQGTARDPEGEARLNHEAARAGDAFAMLNLGVFYFRGGMGVEKDETEARKWIDRAAETGHWAGFDEKGRALLKGEYGYPIDAAEGKRLLQQGVQTTGQAAYLLRIANFYATGFCLRQDMQLAIRFAEAAFRQGNREAARGLAGIYHQGASGVPRDEHRAQFWTVQSQAHSAFSMGPAFANSPVWEHLRTIDPFAVVVE